MQIHLGKRKIESEGKFASSPFIWLPLITTLSGSFAILLGAHFDPEAMINCIRVIDKAEGLIDIFKNIICKVLRISNHPENYVIKNANLYPVVTILQLSSTKKNNINCFGFHAELGSRKLSRLLTITNA